VRPSFHQVKQMKSLNMQKDYRIRIHSIGGEGGVGASEILAEAIGTLTSYHLLQSPFFGTERSGAPAITYLSFSTGPIKERGTIEHPNAIVVFNTKLFSIVPNLLNGFENREGKLIVNTDEDPSNLKGLAKEIFTVDATGIAKRLRLGSATFPIPNTAMVGAILRIYRDVLGFGPRDIRKWIEKKVPVKVKENLEAVELGFESVRKFESPKVIRLKKVSVKDPPFAGISTTLVLSSEEKTGSWATLIPKHQTGIAPCSHHCPAGIEVRKFIGLLSEGKSAEAREVILERSPFPSVCGRVCPHFCQMNCNRRFLDEEVKIGQLERLLGDSTGPGKGRHFSSSKKSRIAVIGAGPGGLTAARDLLRKGYKVTVFEKRSEAGGMLVHGIPDYRLPPEVVKREIAALEEEGVEIRTGIEVGAEMAYSEIASRFDAVILAVGRQIGRTLSIPGESGYVKGVIQGIDFLRLSKSGKGGQAFSPQDRVIVIGGGNTAIDSACTALRWLRKLGNDTPEVTICYRRGLEEMPAFQAEVERARREGIRFKTLLAPRQLLSENGVLRGVEFLECRLSEVDETGRKSPIPVPGSEIVVPCDKLIVATGQAAMLPFDSEAGELTLKEGRVESLPGPPLFFLDDLGTVSEVIGAGHRIAEAVLEALEQKKKPLAEEEKGKIIRFEDLNINYFEKKSSVPFTELTPEESVAGFSEIVQPYGPEEGKAEASRCLSCGECNACDNCYRYCPDMAVIKQDGKYEVNLDYCKGCLVCFQECPRHAIEVAESPSFGGKSFWREKVQNFKIIG
jgi:2-oxoacid:acceptor oxidoreductase gamma subunit (pyruvate/2-ketoisovalerate family)